METVKKNSEATTMTYTVLVTLFVGALLVSNVAATKLITVRVVSWHFIFDGGAVLFPFTYVLGDVLAEVYGFARARAAILLGFVVSIVFTAVVLLVQAAPPADEYVHQAAFEAVLGFVPRIVAASLLAYLTGQLLNAYVLVKMKKRFGDSPLWVRLMGSSAVGEGADTLVFCTVAFLGVLSGANFWNYVIVGYLYKITFETLLLPLSYAVIGWVKKKEQLR